MISAPAGFAGSFLLPHDGGYDDARRVWNGIHDRRPACIARCGTVEDVSRAVRHAGELGLPLTVRGGGHNVAGIAVSDDAYLIDLSPLREVVVDADARVVVAAGGCLLSDVDLATAPYGLACPSGVVSHTGLGGLALGGGYGWLARRWGLTCDHILAAQVVLADGSVIETSAEEHPDLFWVVRGGGGGFGVVTRFTLRLRPVAPMYYHRVVVGLDDAGAALERYRRFAPGQPDDLHVVGSASIAGHHDSIPVSLRGRPAVFLTTLHTGAGEDGPAAVAELFDALPSHVTDRRLISFTDLQALAGAAEPHGHRYYTKSAYLGDLSPATIAGMLDAAADQPSPLGSIDFEYLRGAVDRPDLDRSAFPQRGAPYMCTFSAHWTDPTQDPVHVAWARRGVASTAADHCGGAYLNYLHDEPADAVVAANGPERQSRLDAVRSRYDPAGTFRRSADVLSRIPLYARG